MEALKAIVSNAPIDAVAAYHLIRQTVAKEPVEFISRTVACFGMAHLIQPTTSIVAYFLYQPPAPFPFLRAFWVHLSAWLALTFVINFGWYWSILVNNFVPEPYLDEVFHIPQAQAYCEGNYGHWDDKITTPPGLYLFSIFYNPLKELKCTPKDLRYHNLVVILWIAVIAARCRIMAGTRLAERLGRTVDPARLTLYPIHTAVNIALFPVLFFFTGLYYTDVVSTFAVLLAYYIHLHRMHPGVPSHLSSIATITVGVFALFMRQTNIFWVVGYIGGLEAVHALGQIKPEVHDPPLEKSGPEDWFLFLFTTAKAALTNPLTVLGQIWPHLTVLILFVSFVAYNGGVVLGDKSNHIATIHLSQLHYLFPMFAFFSFPLLLPSLYRMLRQPVSFTLPRGSNPHITVLYTTLTTLASLAVIKFNTIIHPFTLADNRHYMFYVFRYTILKSPIIRFALVVPYTICRWLVWNTLVPPTTPLTVAAVQPRKEKDVRVVVVVVEEPQPPTIAPEFVGPFTSTTLLLFISTALSLVTAPLVEPRYFILPWVFWRLLVPANRQTWFGGAWTLDQRLLLETIWYVLINLVTMYIFLYRPYVWVTDDGKVLDGEKLERFMW
ncbi:DIE2/ALG10 family-domain-containing protein [Podospora fimiseda]|uniref:Dol-P-Glc:Glc(2)Man(9)GlcNAc(2)-PP-Dol alpha-1,2-glucosyltransferase n=1 Tax=Podospora fimiseda TaxID=252190 RepID=A0AAN7H0P2_9PEZI|nr:DIE2/ALG10 family-domain-containing protein [Podospora fimiseda]